LTDRHTDGRHEVFFARSHYKTDKIFLKTARLVQLCRRRRKPGKSQETEFCVTVTTLKKLKAGTMNGKKTTNLK